MYLQAASQKLVANLWLCGLPEVSFVFVRGLWVAQLSVVSLIALVWILED